MAIFNDAQELQKSYPDTFQAPSPDELKALRVGSLVKICADDVERFWVIVTHLQGGQLQGTIDNELVKTEMHRLRCDDVVSFERRHIYEIFRD